MVINMKDFKGFYKKTKDERIRILSEDKSYDTSLDRPLTEEIYSNMIENSLTTYELPMGVVPNFVINGENFHIPMVTEEPSVLAAANNAGKIFALNGGIEAHIISRIMRGQIAYHNLTNIECYEKYIIENKDTLINIAHKAYPSIVKRGGGVKDIYYESKNHPNGNNFFIIYLLVDTQEAMGANMMNTMLEALRSHLNEIFNDEAVMAILSNLSTECLVEASCTLRPSTLKNSDEIVDRMVMAGQLAEVDPYRAATHNKGVMNGIDAVVIATGNDWRAIEASVHAYASLSGQYQPVTHWENKDGNLVGHIKIPMPIGTVGGSIGIHPKAQLAKSILKYEDAQQLMMIIAGVGLAQNFAALYALTTDGIQKGHMALQAKSLAIQAGAKPNQINEVVSKLLKEKVMNLDSAKRIIKSL